MLDIGSSFLLLLFPFTILSLSLLKTTSCTVSFVVCALVPFSLTRPSQVLHPLACSPTVLQPTYVSPALTIRSPTRHNSGPSVRIYSAYCSSKHKGYKASVQNLSITYDNLSTAC